MLARVLWQAGRLDDAEAEARRAVELAPANAGYHDTLALIIAQAGRLDDAEAEARRAVELAPGDAGSQDTLARVLGQAGRLDDAEAEARRAVELAPANAGYHDSLGRILRQRRRFDQAEREHRRAIALNDESALFHEGLGRLLADRPLLHDADVEFRRAIDLDPKLADAYVGLAIITSRAEGKNALGHAVELLEKASDLDRRSYDAQRNLGVALLRLGNYPKAAEVLRSVDPPKDPAQRSDLYFNLGVALWHQGDMTGAENAFREATILNRSDSDAQVNLGISLYQETRFDDAVEAFVNAIRIQPDNPDAHLALSQAYFTKGQFNEGEQSFSKAAELRDPDPDAYLQLSSARAAAGHWEMAEDALFTARARGGDSIRTRTATELLDVYLQLAEARDDPSYLQQALEESRTALDSLSHISSPQTDPTIARIHFQLGLIYFKMGDPGKARDSFRESRDRAPEASATWRGAMRNLDRLKRQRNTGLPLWLPYAVLGMTVASTAFVGWLVVDQHVGYDAFLLSLFGGILTTIAAFGFDALSRFKLGNVELERQSVQYAAVRLESLQERVEQRGSSSTVETVNLGWTERAPDQWRRPDRGPGIRLGKLHYDLGAAYAQHRTERWSGSGG